MKGKDEKGKGPEQPQLPATETPPDDPLFIRPVAKIPAVALMEMKRLHDVAQRKAEELSLARGQLNSMTTVVSACLGVNLNDGKWELNFEHGTFEQIEPGKPADEKKAADQPG